MRILLVIPSHPGRRIPSPDGMPLGLLYLASMVCDKHDVQIVDDYSFPENFNAIKTIEDFQPDIVAISIPFKMLENSARNLACQIREKYNTLIVLGGIHATNAIDRIKTTIPFDFIIPGEGEIVFRELVNDLESGKKNISSSGQSSGKILENKKSTAENIDDLPFPARDLLPGRERYLERIISSRGCGFSCAFCSSRQFWGTFRARNADKIVDELEEIYSVRGLVPVSFADDSFTFDRNHVLNLCGKIRSRKVETGELGFSSHPDRLDEELLEIMRTVGFNSIFLGLESGSDDVLKKIGKMYDRAKIENLLKFALDLGFDIHASFMLGLPGESKSDIDSTLKWADELPVRSIGFHVFYPFEGSPIRMNPGKYGIKIEENPLNEGDIDGEAVVHNGFLSPGAILEYYYRARALAKRKSAGS